MDSYLFGMKLALNEAQKAAERYEVPVGAVILLENRILSAASNQREADQDPTAHAEILALKEASRQLQSWRLTGATMYVTQEPCPMCAGALLNARISRLVYGCSNPKAGAVRTLYQLLEDKRLNHTVEVIPEVLATECSALLSKFFENLRSLGKK